MRDETQRLSRVRARRTGLLICLAALGLLAAFGWGVARQSYWALALPVGLAVSLGAAFAAWTGFTIYRHVRPMEEDSGFERALSRLGGVALVAAGLGGLAAFGWGAAQQSYWALAIPVGLGWALFLGFVFQVGWAIASARSTLPLKAAQEAGRQAASQPSPRPEGSAIPLRPGEAPPQPAAPAEAAS